MSRKKIFEKLFGPDWRKQFEQIRWEAENTAVDRHKRTNTRPAGKKRGWYKILYERLYQTRKCKCNSFFNNQTRRTKKWLHVTFGQDQNKWICYVNSEYTDALVYEFAKPSHQTLFQLTFSEYEFYNSATSLERADEMKMHIRHDHQAQSRMLGKWAKFGWTQIKWASNE